MKKSIFLKKIKDSVNSIEPGAKIILFGSRARGDFKKNSDWDFLILTNRTNVTNDLEKSFHYPLYKIEWEEGMIINAFIYSAMEWETKYCITPLYENIKKEGIEL